MSRAPLAFVALGIVVAIVGCGDDGPRKDPNLGRAEPRVFLDPWILEALEEAEAAAANRGDQAGWKRAGDGFIAWRVNDRAEEAYLRGAELSGPDRFACLYLAGVAVSILEPERSVALLERALEVVSDYAPGHVRLAEVLDRLGRQEDALRSYERALAVDRNSAGALLGLGRHALSRGEDERALDLLDRAWQLDPGRPDVAAALSQALRRRGLDDAAREVADAVPPGHRRPPFHDPLVDVAVANGRALVENAR
jgi:tetratricopeptide (TPR) repeat protein